MGPFRFLRKLSSRRSGWGRNDDAAVASPPEPEDADSDPADPLTALRRYLARHGGRPAGDAAQVARIEERYGVRIPEDFRRYLLEVAPSDDATDDELTAWWSPSRIRNVPEELVAIGTGIHEPSSNSDIAAEEERYLLFADYMIWCWGWAVCCSNGPNRGRVAMIADRDGFVASSFTEFVERYLRNPVETANMEPPHFAGHA